MEYSKTGRFTANQEKLAKEIAIRIAKLRKSGCYVFGNGDRLHVYKIRDIEHEQPLHLTTSSDYNHPLKYLEAGHINDSGAGDILFFEPLSLLLYRFFFLSQLGHFEKAFAYKCHRVDGWLFFFFLIVRNFKEQLVVKIDSPDIECNQNYHEYTFHCHAYSFLFVIHSSHLSLFSASR